MAVQYQRDEHRVHLVVYHLIFCPKRRKSFLVGAVAKECERLILLKCEMNGWQAQKLAVQPDHVYLFVRVFPTNAAADVVKELKAYTSHELRLKFPELKRRLPSLWTRSYFASTADHISPDDVQHYIQAQKAHNTSMMIREFMKRHFRHFNAAVCVEAADAWIAHLDGGGKMFLTLAGAMSTAELGISVAELIRQDKVHGICCTGANLEEDIFNLVAHSHYERVPGYRSLSAAEEVSLRERGLNRVTDTCIPEDTAIRKIEEHMLTLWRKADRAGESYFPYQFFYQLLESGAIRNDYEIDPADSWMVAAQAKGLPIWTPGWEDSTLANIFTSHVIKGTISRPNVVRSGVEQMQALVHWYQETTKTASLGFFQIGGGIAGDFPICVVPLIQQDLEQDCPLWGYFAQIGDSTTSYGSYSGAVPNEKITWGKLDGQTPKFMIESDATIVAPLIFHYVLGE